ncbi:hypothetical protein KYB31_17470 [Clostridium felsineum]|nr:hypothetical protein [Clostridium felsineum]MCR3760773.1 hypothetical protein [Clostridium felsineum]
MPPKTGRFYECVKVCKGAPLFIENNTVKVDHRGSLAATWYPNLYHL